jgi:predicted metalloendopeptidase
MMLQNMNTTIDPCEDFYEFSCGGFMSRARLEDHESAKTTFNDLSDNLAKSLSGILLMAFKLLNKWLTKFFN